MSGARVLVSCVQMQRELPRYEELFRERGIETVVPTVVQQLTETDLLEIMPVIDGVIAGDDHFTAKVLEASPRLKILSKWGIGTDAIDKEAAARLGIPVTNTPGVFGDEVADLAFGLVLALSRRVTIVDAAVRRGEWPRLEGESLAGQTAGLVGLGSIGRAIAVRAKAFGMNLIGYDPAEGAQEAFAELGGVPKSLTETLQDSDYLLLAAPLSGDSRHLIDRTSLALMKPTAKVVNVARGQLIDEGALAEALRAGALGGAGLDVFEVEPLPMDSPLRDFDTVVLSSHNGSNARQGVERASALAVENLLRHLEA